MSAYYNEHDKFAAAWLRELIKARLIADGDVDERDIQDVGAGDVRGFTQCHFFAGIGGWSYALRLAGWPDDRPVWTGSCPCQGYSAAGKQQGAADARNLWPSWFRLIGECQPVTVFGEQVANATGHGWLDAVSTDLEGMSYALGAVVLGAHSVGAPHRRQRLWFVADAQCERARGDARTIRRTESAPEGQQPESWGAAVSTQHGSATGLVADAECGTAERSGLDVGDAATGIESAAQERQRLRDDAGDGGDVGDVGDTKSQRREGGHTNGTRADLIGPTRSISRAWDHAEFIPCGDGKSRPTQSGLFPLAHGVSARVGRLRGYGNAIVPAVAAEVIAAYMELQ